MPGMIPRPLGHGTDATPAFDTAAKYGIGENPVAPSLLTTSGVTMGSSTPVHAPTPFQSGTNTSSRAYWTSKDLPGSPSLSAQNFGSLFKFDSKEPIEVPRSDPGSDFALNRG